VIYCINPNCFSKENRDEATICASCGTPLLIENRITLTKRITTDEDTEVYEIIDDQKTFSLPAGSVKILKILKNTNPDRLQAFRDEADILQGLNHKGIPKVDALYDFFFLDIAACNQRIYCLAMLKFEGDTLEQYIIKNGAISQKRAVDFLQQLANILNYIHTIEGMNYIGIIHRDIKPSNIIVQPNGNLALIDFGFALKMSEIYLQQLRTGEISRVESLYYTPPEQNERKPVLQSDYYALGRTLIYAITGKDLYSIGCKKNSWNLDWEKHAKVDKPLIQVFQQLTDQNYLKRPTTPDDLLRIVNKTLPDKLKFYLLFRSKLFRLSAIVITILAIIGLFQLGRRIVSGHYIDDGNKALNENRFNDAKTSYEIAINIYPSADAYNNLGLACNRLGDLDCQEKSYKRAIELSPNDWVAYHRLARYHEDALKPNYSKSEYYSRKAVTLSQSKLLLPISDLARTLLLNKKYNNAKMYIDLGLTLSKDDKSEARLKRTLGWYYFDRKQYDNAEVALKQAIQLDPSLNGPHCLLAGVYKEIKKSFNDEADACITLNGNDLLNIEVIRWRKEWIDKLIRKNAANMPS
jgi:serine/threonine protein kinase